MGGLTSFLVGFCIVVAFCCACGCEIRITVMVLTVINQFYVGGLLSAKLPEAGMVRGHCSSA